jgi:hypothetical protein
VVSRNQARATQMRIICGKARFERTSNNAGWAGFNIRRDAKPIDPTMPDF